MPNIDETILSSLLKPIARRGGISFCLLGIPAISAYKEKTVKNAVTRLKGRKLIEIESTRVSISAEGKRYLKSRRTLFPTYRSPFPAHAKKNSIVMFDIPEERKAQREWFRRQLREFGYEMIQKSVWFGPSPLPKEFVSYVKSVGLGNAIKIFKTTGPIVKV